MTVAVSLRSGIFGTICVCRLASNADHLGCVNLKRTVNSSLLIRTAEIVEKTPVPIYMQTDADIYGKRQKNDKPRWSVEDGNAEDVPWGRYPAPKLRSACQSSGLTQVLDVSKLTTADP
jgi:hypothetical protein